MSPYKRNPVFWLMLLLPAAGVVAGLTTLAIALKKADHPLPAAYHWEGEHLERDFALARNAAQHGIEVSFDAAGGSCSATLRHAPDDPAALTLQFANTADAAQDRVILLKRISPGLYGGECAPLPNGRWRVSLEDVSGTWSIRTQATGAVAQLEMRARNPDGAT